jgi:hypothetical protein
MARKDSTITPRRTLRKKVKESIIPSSNTVAIRTCYRRNIGTYHSFAPLNPLNATQLFSYFSFRPKSSIARTTPSIRLVRRRARELTEVKRKLS